MRDSRYIVTLLIFCVAQVLVWNYFDLSQYLILTVLPVLVLCLPVRYSTISVLLISFALGLFVDFFSCGIMGLATAPLVLVAYLRRPIIKLVFGEDVFSRRENLSIRRQGLPKMIMGIIIVTLIFLILYNWLDGSGTRSGWFNFLRVFFSLLTDTLISFFSLFVLCEEDVPGWR